jgi:hypothetical protein
MTRITWEAEEHIRKTTEPTPKSQKRLPRGTPRGVIGLTCTEANADSILSEGESI